MQSLPFSEARAHLAEALPRIEPSQEPLLISRLAQWRIKYATPANNDGNFSPERDHGVGRDFSW